MQMTNSARTNIVPSGLLIACAVLLFLRATCIIYDAYAVPPAVNLVDWQQLKPFDPDYPDLLQKPTLLYFADSGNVFEKLKCNTFESTILKNREVATALKNNFNCMKVELANKQDKVSQALARRMGVTSTPEIFAVLPNGQSIDGSDMQYTDRLFVSQLRDVQHQKYKVAGDLFMQRADFQNARAAYKKYFDLPGTPVGYRGSVTIRYYMACKLLGLNADAAELLTDSSKQGDAYSSMGCIEFLRGRITAEKLWSEYGKDSNPTTIKYVIGMKQLFDGNEQEAIKNLLWVARHGRTDNPDFKIARAQLKTLHAELPPAPEEDPDAFGSARSSYE